MTTKSDKIKIMYIVSDIDRWIAFEWIVERLNRKKFEFEFILLNEGSSYFEEYLKNKGVVCHRIMVTGKRNFFRVCWSIRNLLLKTKPDIVHTHFLKADLMGLWAARLAGVKKRFHTRHSSTFHRQYTRWGPVYDKSNNLLSTKIIAISENVRQILVEKEGVDEKHVVCIHHGFDLDHFLNVSPTEVQDLDSRYNPKQRRPVVGVISRYIEWKGIQFIIPAFQKILKEYPNAILILANARGAYQKNIQELLKALPTESFCEVPFEKNLFALYRLFDVFVHVPVDAQIEAFGQVYVEALAAGIPSVFTLSGVGTELIRDGENGLVVPFRNSEAIANSILRLLGDDKLRVSLAEKGKLSVNPRFQISLMIKRLEELYSL